MKVGCYIDGFNLYHAIDALGDHALKWIDLKSLARSYCRTGETLEVVRFYTALNTWDAPKRSRHLNYIKALESTGVSVNLSKFDRLNKYCHKQDRYCPMREEKQTDVALAVGAVSDCMALGLGRLILITADSDQIPTAKAVKVLFPQVTIFLVAPPKRLTVARELGGACDGIAELSAGRLRQHQMAGEIRVNGKLIAQRPALYGGAA